MSNDLPNGWEAVPLKDLLTPRSDRVSPQSMPNAPFIGMEYVEPHTNQVLETVPASTMASNAARFYEGDVLYGRMRPYLNKVVSPSFDGLASAEFIVFPKNEIIDSRFLLRRLSSNDFTQFACSKYEGDRPRVKFDQLGNFEVLVPPAAEQTRIVEKLEELLSDLDAGAAELKTAQSKLAQYRQSLLKAAVEGALTADWRAANGQPQETGAELLQRILSERRTCWEQKQLAKFAEQGKAPPKGWQAKYPEPVAPDLADLPLLPDGWVWASIGQFGEVTTGFTPSTSNAEYFGGDIPFFKPTDLDAGYEVREFRESLTVLGVEQGRLLPTNSVLVTCIGATIGKTGLARVPCATNQQINAVSPVEDSAQSEYLYFVLTSNFGQRQIIGNASATTLPILNKSKFERLPVPMPGRQEQAEIVRLLEREMDRVAEQEAAIVLSLKQVAAQRKNLLKAAFAGQLVPQNPNDEPASELLARIRAERASNDGDAPRRRRKSP